MLRAGRPTAVAGPRTASSPRPVGSLKGPCGARKPRSAARAAAEGEVAGGGQTLVPLGGSGLSISRMGLGTLSWGDPTDGYGNRFGDSELARVYSAAREGGINFFDTAEVYGYQSIKTASSSECLLGELAQNESPGDIVVGTKFFTIPWTNMLVGGGVRLGKQSLIEAARASVQRLGTGKADLYMIHFPFPTFSQEALMDGLKMARDEGLCTAVGVCNYDASQLEKAAELLAKNDISLACNQFKYSLMDRSAEQNGLLAKCKELDVTPVAHTPLARGVLTEAALDDGREDAKDVAPLLKLMQLIGAFNGGKTVTQVALAYLMAKGAVPIPGCTNPDRVSELVGALSYAMDPEDVAVLDEKADYMFGKGK